jgi:Flp pilus assembly protein TadD
MEGRKPARLAAPLFGAMALLAVSAWAHLGDDDESPSDDPNIVEGKKAIEDKDFKRAIALLQKSAAAEPNNASVQNYLGFAYRNLGNYELALKYYEQALRLSPAYKAAHEYIGEAYLMLNDLPKAEEHLAMLDQICMMGCDELKELKDKVAEYKKKNKK